MVNICVLKMFGKVIMIKVLMEFDFIIYGFVDNVLGYCNCVLF